MNGAFFYPLQFLSYQAPKGVNLFYLCHALFQEAQGYGLQKYQDS